MIIYKISKLFCSLFFMGILTGCQNEVTTQEKQVKYYSLVGLHDFGDPNLIHLKQKINSIDQLGGPRKLVITQFGDSHSAADYFTGHLRVLLQSRFGNGGIGWIPPISIPGQYHTAVKWKSNGWNLTSSRNSTGDFPIGGFIAKSNFLNSEIEVIPSVAFDEKELWSVKLLIKTPHSQMPVAIFNNQGQNIDVNKANMMKNHWSDVTFKTTLPFTIKSEVPDLEVGGIWLERENSAGAIVSAVGTNGAQLSIMDKWSSDWWQQLNQLNSDLIILEYGTNESFNNSFNIANYKRSLIEKIALIRQVNSQAVILIMSPPDTLIANATGNCEDRLPPYYGAIKAAQLEVAKSEKTLYWDWQSAMGDKCIIEKWSEQGLAQKDLVHLTRKGYEKTAKIFYRDLIRVMK